MPIRVGELARRTGVGVGTLRAWERRFDFLEPVRSPAGHRLYCDDDVERVEAVVRLVTDGLTLPAAVARVSNLGTGALPGGEGEEFFFGQILQVASQGVWVSRHGRTRYVNSKMAELMGCSVAEMLTRPVLDFHTGEERLADEARGERVRAGERLNFTQELRRLDGSTFLAQGTTTPLFNHSGQYEGSVAMVDDITARAEEEAQSRFRNALLDAIGDAVLAAKPDGTIVYANAAAERLLGWKVSELIGENGLELLAPKDTTPDGMVFHSRLLEKTSQSGELPIARRDGTQVLAHITGTPVLDRNRELVGLIAVLVDNTDRRQIEYELGVQEQQAEVVALLGTEALRSRPGDEESVLIEIVEAVRRVLQSEYGLLVDIGPEGYVMRVASPHYDEADEAVQIPSRSRSLSGYTARARKVVIVEDATRDRRFDFAPGSMQFGIRSAIAAPVIGPGGVRAVLMAASPEPAKFSQSSAQFMQNMANVVGIVLRHE
jgi:PAS domain S-box-containing protein